MNDRLTVSSAVPAEIAERMSDRGADMPMPAALRAKREAEKLWTAKQNAYHGIRDAEYLADILNYLRDAGPEFDQALALVLTALPRAIGALQYVPKGSPERNHLEGLFAAVAKMEKQLYERAYDDELAAIDQEDA